MSFTGGTGGGGTYTTIGEPGTVGGGSASTGGSMSQSYNAGSGIGMGIQDSLSMGAGQGTNYSMGQMTGDSLNQGMSASTGQAGTYWNPLQQQAAGGYIPYLQGQLAPTAQYGGTPGAGQYGGGGYQSFDPYFGAVGGGAQQYPGITTGGVYSPETMQSAPNALLADQQRAAGAANAELANQFGARFGMDSPLLAELQANRSAQGYGMGTEQARQWTQQAEEANSRQNLASEQARAGVFGQQQADDMRRRELAMGMRNQDIQRTLGLRGQDIGADQAGRAQDIQREMGVYGALGQQLSPFSQSTQDAMSQQLGQSQQRQLQESMGQYSNYQLAQALGLNFQAQSNDQISQSIQNQMSQSIPPSQAMSMGGGGFVSA